MKKPRRIEPPRTSPADLADFDAALAERQAEDRRENAWEREMEYREALRDEAADAAMDERRLRGGL